MPFGIIASDNSNFVCMCNRLVTNVYTKPCTLSLEYSTVYSSPPFTYLAILCFVVGIGADTLELEIPINYSLFI